jgi:carboxyl-terminal processing protease
MSKITKLIISLFIVIAIALSFGAGFTFGRHTTASPGTGLDTVGQAWNIILTDYVDKDKINTGNMSQAAIEGMLQALNDPYSSYLEAKYYEMGLSSLEGEFNGIGAYITVKDKQLTIIAPIAGSPAEKAGIRPGDVILEVNDEPVAEMSLAEAILKIRGPQGTTVKLFVRHEGQTEAEILEIVRDRIEVPSVRFEMKGEIAYINITQFSERTEKELISVLQNPAMAKATGIILDLRDNPGGLLDTVVEVASHFLHDGTVVQVRNNKGEVTTLQVKSLTPVTDLPMVVLVNDASASGSEVLSGALQDHKRAIIAGTKTFGKGSVDILFPLNDGSGLYLTVSRWLTPNGRLIEGEGIEPDQTLEVTGDDAIKWATDYLINQG